MPDLKNWPVPRLLSTAARLMEHRWNDQLAELKLTHAGLIALEVLAGEGEMTQAQLAGRVRVQAQTMGQTLARLEANGHILRVRNQEDRRRQWVSISEEGQVAVKEAGRLEQLLIGSDEDQMSGLKEQLTGIIRALGNSRFGIQVPDQVEPG